MKMRINLLIFLLILLAMIISGCSKSPEKIIEAFENSIAEKDAEGLFKLIHIEDGVYWSEKEAKDVIDYFTDNKTAYDEQLKYLHDQKFAIKEKNVLVNEKGIFYFDDEKKFVVRAYEVSLDQTSFVEFEELIVSVLNDEEIKVKSGSDEDIIIGLFGPGYYRVKGFADYGYVTLEDHLDFEMFSLKDFNRKIELDLKGQQATVFSDEPNTILYINDYKVTHDIGVEEGITIQPLVNGLILRAENEFSWGNLVGDEFEFITENHFVENGIDLTPYLFENAQEKEEIAHIITDFNEKLLNGLAEIDPSYLDDVIATDEAIAGYDSLFERLTLVEKGELKASSFPHGIGIAIVGLFEGGLLESIIDFSHPETIKDPETNEDLLVLKVNLDTNFVFVPKDFDEARIDKESNRFFAPIIQLKKENDQWIIAEQLIDFLDVKRESQLMGEHLVTTKVDRKN